MSIWKVMLAAAAVATMAGTAGAQDYPSQPIEIVVPFAPGGSTDLSARIFAEGMQEKLGVPVRVNNITGGQTLPAVETVQNAAPDGYTLLLDGQSQTVLLEKLVPDLPFDIMDRSFIAETVRLNNIMFTRPDSPLQSLDDVIEKLKTDPQSLSWGSLGGTGLSDTGFLRMFREIGVERDAAREAVFKGGSEVVTQVAGGHIDLGISSPTSLKPFVESGKVHPIAVLGNERNVLYPDTPTTAELGHPDITAIQWNGISGPPGMDEKVVAMLHKTIQELLADEAFVAKLSEVGLDPYPSELGHMRTLVTEERASFKDLFGSAD